MQDEVEDYSVKIAELEQRIREREVNTGKLREVVIEKTVQLLLLQRGVAEKEILSLALRQSLSLDDELRPYVKNEKGERRMQVVNDAEGRPQVVPMTAEALVDEFLRLHPTFLPTESPQAPTQTDVEYQRALEKAQQLGRLTPEYRKAAAIKFGRQ